MKYKFIRILLPLFLFATMIFAKGNNFFSDFDNPDFRKNNPVILKANPSKISSERAKEIALNDARVSKNNARFKKIELDTEDGMLVYEIEFYADNVRYQYEIDAHSGNIVKFKSKVKK